MQEIERSSSRRKNSTSTNRGGIISSKNNKCNRQGMHRELDKTCSKIFDASFFVVTTRVIDYRLYCCCIAIRFWTRHMPPLNEESFEKSRSPRLTRCPEPLPPEWIQIKMLRSPGSPVKRLSMHKKQHPLHPVLPLGKEKDVALIHHHQDQQPPTKIIVVSVWRICRWIMLHLHA